MSFAFRLDGVAMEATFTAPATLINIGTTADWEIEFRIKIPVGGLSTGSTTQYIFGSNGSTLFGVYHRPAGGQGALAVITSGTFKFGSSAGMLLADDEFHTYRIYKATATGNNIYFERDGVLFGSPASYSTSQQLTVGRFGRGSSTATTYWVFELDYAKYNHISSSSLIEWRADLANGSGTTLFTTDNSRDATISGYAVNDNSWWVSYGGSNTLELSPIEGQSLLSAALSTGILLGWVQSSTSSLSSDVRTGSTLSADMFSAASSTGYLLVGTTLSIDMPASCSLAAEFSTGGAQLAANLLSSSVLLNNITTGVKISSALPAASSMSAFFYSPPPDPTGTLQNRKLILLMESGLSYPDNTINDAMDNYLEVRYSVDQGLSDMIARYLQE